MILDIELMKDILFVKHNCSFRSLMNHINLLKTHFNIEDTDEENIRLLLYKIEQDKEYQLINERILKIERRFYEN